ncbi:MAG: hypothetical protein H0S79_14455 [Anaerolineaceae bacterium]|nr:hypothetical protein [Anaerolineaceae bacterium]
MTFKKFIIILVIVILLIVAAVIVEKQTLFLRRMVDAQLYGSYFHYLPCDALPTDAEVRQALRDHADIAQAIRDVNPGNVGIMIGSPCWDKADLTIWYNDRADRQEIETFLSEDLLFFGIPVDLDGQYDR